MGWYVILNDWSVMVTSSMKEILLDSAGNVTPVPGIAREGG